MKGRSDVVVVEARDMTGPWVDDKMHFGMRDGQTLVCNSVWWFQVTARVPELDAGKWLVFWQLAVTRDLRCGSFATRHGDKVVGEVEFSRRRPMGLLYVGHLNSRGGETAVTLENTDSMTFKTGIELRRLVLLNERSTWRHVRGLEKAVVTLVCCMRARGIAALPQEIMQMIVELCVSVDHFDWDAS